MPPSFAARYRRWLIGITCSIGVMCMGPRMVTGEETRLLRPIDVDATARQVLRPGDTLILAEGEWRDRTLIVHADASKEAPAVIRAQTPGKVRFTGRSSIRLSGSHITLTGIVFQNPVEADEVVSLRTSSRAVATDCRITDCLWEQTEDSATDDRAAKESKWLSIYGQRHRIDHCAFTGKRNRGATVVVWVDKEPGSHRIDHNYFGPRPDLGKNGGETIRIGTSDVSLNEEGSVVEFNHFEACDGETETISNKSCGNVYRSNLFRRCQGTLTLRHGNRCLVEGNVFLGEGKARTGGIRLIGEGHRVRNNYLADLQGDEIRAAISMMNGIVDTPLEGYAQVRDAEVVFNTIVGCKQSLAVGVESSKKRPLAPENCEFSNNAILAKSEWFFEFAAPRGWRSRGNLVETRSNDELPEGFRRIKLDFAAAPDGLWRPGESSTVRGAAEGDWPDVIDDLEGRPRVKPYDVGCFQLEGNPLTRIPQRQEVGVSFTPPSSD